MNPAACCSYTLSVEIKGAMPWQYSCFLEELSSPKEINQNRRTQESFTGSESSLVIFVALSLSVLTQSCTSDSGGSTFGIHSGGGAGEKIEMVIDLSCERLPPKCKLVPAFIPSFR